MIRADVELLSLQTALLRTSHVDPAEGLNTTHEALTYGFCRLKITFIAGARPGTSGS